MESTFRNLKTNKIGNLPDLPKRVRFNEDVRVKQYVATERIIHTHGGNKKVNSIFKNIFHIIQITLISSILFLLILS